MSVARIYQRSKTAMQSGRGKTGQWVLEFEPESPKTVDPLMGYTGSSDMLQQVKITFETRDEALAYAQRKGIAAEVIEPADEAPRRLAAYSDNFRANRVGTWTH